MNVALSPFSRLIRSTYCKIVGNCWLPLTGLSQIPRKRRQLVRDRLCAKLNRQEKTLIDEFRVLPSADSAMTSIRQKWAHAWRGRGLTFVSDPTPDGIGIAHTLCLIACRPMA